MKKLLTIAMMTAAVSAMAVESSNTFGILRVDSSAAETIVSIPWLAAGGGSIKVKDVVKTANLKKGSDVDGTGGDQLFYYADGSYKMWQLNNNGEWVGANIYSNDKLVASAGNNETLERGKALVLKRNAPIASNFYLYGQYAAVTAGDKTTLPNGALSLIAPPMTENINITSMTWENVGLKDKILIPSNTPGVTGEIIRNSANNAWVTLKYDSTKPVGQKWVEEPVSYDIPAGQGVWFKSGRVADSTDTAASVTWVAPAQ